MSLKEAVANRIQVEMDHQGISQRELARRVGVDQKWVQRRLTGVIEFRPSDIEAVATALDVPVQKFLAGAA